jgi:outer membrane protein assembly factor BamD
VVSFKNLLKDFPDSKYQEMAFYYIMLSNYYYALNSIENKKLERLNSAKDGYNALISSYPNSVYENSSKSVIENINDKINRLSNSSKTIIPNKKIIESKNNN